MRTFHDSAPRLSNFNRSARSVFCLLLSVKRSWVNRYLFRVHSFFFFFLVLGCTVSLFVSQIVTQQSPERMQHLVLFLATFPGNGFAF